MPDAAAIEGVGLTKHYGATRAVEQLDLVVRTGEVFGFLGPNGSGKTTTIRLLLDLIRPTSGSVRVLGHDPRRGGVALRRRIGYLSGDFAVDGRQTARELLTYLGNLRGGVSARTIDELAERLDLDLDRRIKALSRGNRQKVGVIQAFMHEPELLILDEPTSGLDPFLQHEFVSMARATAADGRTVFMSSHVMSEVQRTADRVAIIHRGRLATVAGIDELQQRSRRHVEIHFAEPVAIEEFESISGVSDIAVDGVVFRCILDGPADDLVKAAARHEVVSLIVDEPDLEELFFESSGNRVEPGDPVPGARRGAGVR